MNNVLMNRFYLTTLLLCLASYSSTFSMSFLQTWFSSFWKNTLVDTPRDLPKNDPPRREYTIEELQAMLVKCKDPQNYSLSQDNLIEPFFNGSYDRGILQTIQDILSEDNYKYPEENLTAYAYTAYSPEELNRFKNLHAHYKHQKLQEKDQLQVQSEKDNEREKSIYKAKIKRKEAIRSLRRALLEAINNGITDENTNKSFTQISEQISEENQKIQQLERQIVCYQPNPFLPKQKLETAQELKDLLIDLIVTFKSHLQETHDSLNSKQTKSILTKFLSNKNILNIAKYTKKKSIKIKTTDIIIDENFSDEVDRHLRPRIKKRLEMKALNDHELAKEAFKNEVVDQELALDLEQLFSSNTPDDTFTKNIPEYTEVPKQVTSNDVESYLNKLTRKNYRELLERDADDIIDNIIQTNIERITKKEYDEITSTWNKLREKYNSNWLEAMWHPFKDGWNKLETFHTEKISMLVHSDRNRKNNTIILDSLLKEMPITRNEITREQRPFFEPPINLALDHGIASLMIATNKICPRIFKDFAHEKRIADYDQAIKLTKIETMQGLEMLKNIQIL